jgi:hypothetical protein
MKLSEIVLSLKNGKKVESLEINIKKYLPIVEKMVMIKGLKDGDINQNGIVDESLEEHNGLLYVDYFKKEISIVCNLIQWYTDIEIDIVELENTHYDFYVTSGLWDYIKSNLNNEYKTNIELIDMSIEEELRKHNSMESIVNNNLVNLINRIPTDKELKQLAKTLMKDVNKMNWDKVPMIKQMFETLQSKKVE